MCLSGDPLSSLLPLSLEDWSDHDALVGALKRWRACSTLNCAATAGYQGSPLEAQQMTLRDWFTTPTPTFPLPWSLINYLSTTSSLLPAKLIFQMMLAPPKSLQEDLKLATERKLLCAGTDKPPTKLVLNWY